MRGWWKVMLTREEFIRLIHEDWEQRSCTYCGRRLADGEGVDAHIPGGETETLCQSCHDILFVPCIECGAIQYRENMLEVGDGQRVCQTCFSEHYARCENCGRVMRQEDSVLVNNSDIVCPTCYENYHECRYCGGEYHADNMRSTSRGWVCDQCYENRERAIKQYNYKPSPIFHGDTLRYYGVELEVDLPEDEDMDEDDLEEAARCVQESIDDDCKQFYIKHDGSLHCGYEVVTHPCSLDYHLTTFPWESICRQARSGGFRSHDVDSAGLHVHVSRKGLGATPMEQDLTTAKIMLLFDKWWHEKIVPFSRRNSSALASWAKKPDVGMRETDTPDAVIDKSKSSSNRYRSINLQNRNTIEFRIFRGTLKVSTIRATLQWLDVLIDYAMRTDLSDIWKSDWDSIFAGTQHEELQAYLKDRHLFDGDF